MVSHKPIPLSKLESLLSLVRRFMSKKSRELYRCQAEYNRQKQHKRHV